MAERKKSTPSFEKSLGDLEKIVQQMEKGDLPLEKTISLYEKGMKLAKQCDNQLNQAQLKIEELKVGETDE